MPDKTTNKETSQTGELPRVEAELDLPRESQATVQYESSTPLDPSSTGVMRIIPETEDETAIRDTDKPTTDKD